MLDQDYSRTSCQITVAPPLLPVSSLVAIDNHPFVCIALHHTPFFFAWHSLRPQYYIHRFSTTANLFSHPHITRRTDRITRPQNPNHPLFVPLIFLPTPFSPLVNRGFFFFRLSHSLVCLNPIPSSLSSGIVPSPRLICLHWNWVSFLLLFSLPTTLGSTSNHIYNPPNCPQLANQIVISSRSTTNTSQPTTFSHFDTKRPRQRPRSSPLRRSPRSLPN